MEYTTIIGIVIAVIIMLFGVRMIFRKPADAAPSLESALHIDADSQKPIIPRHVRDQLQTTASVEEAERKEPTLNESSVEETLPEKAEPKALDADSVLESSNTEPSLDVSAEVENKAVDLVTPENAVADATELTTESASSSLVDDQAKADKAEFSLNANVEKAEISEFDDESSILDAHLYEQKIVDDESALATAESFIALNVYPERRALSGEKTLKVLMKYGLRFGEMSCFHRYNEDGTKLLFSVLQITDTGMDGFDLENLSTDPIKGLAFFLALPHRDVQNAFDTMDSISRLIAREIDGTVYDQNNQEFTPQLREHWRHLAIDYRAGQAIDA
ncbi:MULTISPECIES: cell division protein ZipA C-terminal FtsZ-binding domain-containing protein [Acinetobacter]|nr:MULTISPECIES: cell division protein ZipA C-terminal FtsZ-binding domain-containing protein [Acinetobacter]MDD0801440.1 cell division protein ZipA C-terminal FtsZ-binding domain-containing protein [Acinetobacter sp. Gutcm_16]NKG36647.1 cell division protein ZipA [Acinetobacter johnsonii]